MDNRYQPGAAGGSPADAALSSSHPSPPYPQPDQAGQRPRRRWFRWGVGMTLAGFLVGGGITLAAVSGGTTASASPAGSPAASTVSGAAGAQLNTALTDAAGA